jgi:hypothetical protein
LGEALSESDFGDELTPEVREQEQRLRAELAAKR